MSGRRTRDSIAGGPTRRAFLRVGAAVPLALSAGCQTFRSNTNAADAGVRTILGAYPGTHPAARTTFGPFERWLGRRHAVIVLYVDALQSPRAIRRFVTGPLTRVWKTGHVPMVTWEPHPRTPAERERGIVRAMRDGKLDGFLDRWAGDLDAWLRANSGRRLYFRPLPEMNRPGIAWSNADPGTYRDAWVHLHERFDRPNRFNRPNRFADRIQWVWNPNATDVGTPPAEKYYPGDASVDWVGIDGYNFGDSAPWSTWQNPAEIFSSMLDRVRTLADKPVAIAEFASTSRRTGDADPEAKAAWITAAFEFVRRNHIRMACWFNLDKETDWSVFGGSHGTARYRGTNDVYRVYSAYRNATTRTNVVGAGHVSKGILSNDTFEGTD